MKVLTKMKVWAMLVSALLINTVNAESIVDKKAEFQEGVHFKQIAGASFKANTVEEFFSFYCPHCFRAEVVVKEIKANLPAQLTFVRRHVNGMPGIAMDTQNDLSRYLIASRKIDQEEAFVKGVFNQIHVQKQKDFSPQKLDQLLKASAIDVGQFRQALEEQSVVDTHDSQLKRLAHMRANGFGGVPSFVVNGKYQLIGQNIRGLEDFTKVIAFLSQKDS